MRQYKDSFPLHEGRDLPSEAATGRDAGGAPQRIFRAMDTEREAAAQPQWRVTCGDDEIGRSHFLDAAMALARIHAGSPLHWVPDIATLGSVATLLDGRTYRVEPSGPRDVS